MAFDLSVASAAMSCSPEAGRLELYVQPFCRGFFFASTPPPFQTSSVDATTRHRCIECPSLAAIIPWVLAARVVAPRAGSAGRCWLADEAVAAGREMHVEELDLAHIGGRRT